MAGLQGRVIGGYQLADQLNGGGIAEVYRARPATPHGREVVVKVIYPEFVQQPGFRARFEQIVKNATRLSHPHILPLVASGEQNGYLYIITPYVAAGTLRDWLAAGRRLDSHDVAPFFRQLCEATGYAHSQSVLHGNIKPSNVFLYEGRHVLLGDFGRLWDVNQLDMTHAGPGIEAVEYLAPEAIEGRGDQRSDIYSLGAVLFASLTGRAPYNGTTPFEVFTKHQQHPVPHLADVAPPLRASVVPLDDVVQRAMAKDPAARYPSALALAQSIETTVRGAVAQGAAPMGAPGMGGMPGGAGPVPLGGGMPGMPGIAAAMPLGALGGVPAAMADAVGPGMVFSPLGGGPAGGAAPGTHSPLGQLSFPPLPSTGLVDPAMEEGRPGSGPFGGNAGGLASPALPPAALPAQPGAPGLLPSAAMPPAGSPGIPAGDAYDIPALPTQRVAAAPPLGAPAGGDPFDPTAQPTQRVAAPPERGPMSNPGPLGPTPPGMPQMPGFVVKGGAAQWPPATADLAAEAAARSPARFGSEPGLGGPGGPAGAPDFGAFGEFGEFGEFGVPGGPSGPLSPESRPYSATKLGLPRLTSPELGDLPASWRDIASGPQAAPGQTRQDEADEDEPPGRWGGGAGWTGETGSWSESDQWRDASGQWGEDRARWGESAPWSEESRAAAVPGQRDDGGRWADSTADSQEYPAESGQWAASMDPVPDLFSSSSLLAMDADAQRRRRSGKRRWSFGARLSQRPKTSGPELEDEPAGDPFADPEAWARPGDVGYARGRTRYGRAAHVRAPRVRGPRRMGPLLLILVLLVLVDGTLVVMLRPDLCPANRCAALHTMLDRYLPAGASQAAAPSPLTAAPEHVALQVAAGGSASTPLTLTNTGKTAAAWTANSELKWVSVGTASGNLAPGASAKVTLTAGPAATVKPGTYNTTVTFVVGGTQLNVPVVVTVTAPHR